MEKGRVFFLCLLLGFAGCENGMGKVLRRKQTWMYSKPKDRGNINRCDRNVNTTAYEKKT